MIMGFICGPTGIGKSDLAVRIARANGFEIISADAVQVYKNIPIGTSQPGADLLMQAPHHLVGFLEGRESYSVHRYKSDVCELVNRYPEKKFLIVGGSGLYIRSLRRSRGVQREETPTGIRERAEAFIRENGLERAHVELQRVDPRAAEKINPRDRYRITKALENFWATGESYVRYDYTGDDERFAPAPLLCLKISRKILYQRINQRVKDMLAAGWMEEVSDLIEANPAMDWSCLKALGYRDLAFVLQGKVAMKIAVEQIQQKTRHYAKRQMTFFNHQLPEAVMIDVDEIGANPPAWIENWDGAAFDPSFSPET